MRYYAQINYQQKVGNSNLTLAEVGCFVTSDCNLAQDAGYNIDPPTLNNFYASNGIYTYDVADHANDDITWGSITSRFPNLVVKEIGSAGWPDSNLAIVKFYYKSHAGYMTTHFCKVHNFETREIVDSYDGLIKGPAAYDGYYGDPVQWATYIDTAPATTPSTEGKKLFLPSEAGTWRVYSLAGPFTVGNEVGKLVPGSYPPGLTYDILGSVAPDIYHIHTSSFGDVAIYAGSDTVAKFVDEAPSTPAAPAPAEEQVKANPFTRFPNPMNLVVNKQPTHVWDLTATTAEEFKSIKDLNQGDDFTAVGKYQHPLGGVYFMDDASFGQADTTSTPSVYAGINTVDLSPAPAESEGEKVNVTVNSWKDSFKESFGIYKSVANIVVHDLDGLQPDQKLGRDTKVTIAGTFTKDGQKYYRTVISQNLGHWYGIPENSLVQYASADSKIVDAVLHPSHTAHVVADEIDKISEEFNNDPEYRKYKTTLTPRGKAVAAIGETEDKVAGFFGKIHVFKNKYK